MKFRKEGERYLVSLDIGDPIHETLAAFAKSEGITSWWHQGIGVLRDPILGFYEVEKKEYLEQQFTGDYEILSISGNLSKKEGKPFLHSHASLSGKDFTAIGGHLFEATISAAAEFIILPLENPIEREFSEESGLFVWDLKD